MIMFEAEEYELYNILYIGGVKMTTFFSVIALASSLGLIISVALQESSESSGVLGGGGSEASWGQSRGSSKEEILKKVTVVSAVVFIVSHLILTILG